MYPEVSATLWKPQQLSIHLFSVLSATLLKGRSKQTKTLGGISFWKTSEDMRNELRQAFSHENKSDLQSYKEKLAKITQPQTAKIEDNSFTMKK